MWGRGREFERRRPRYLFNYLQTSIPKTIAQPLHNGSSG
jgi:hypothetical protein